jgi:phosphotransferase system HPr (HPr) family protein
MPEPSRRQVEVTSAFGFHFRAASRFVQLSQQFQVKIRVSCDGRAADGRSILDLIALAAGCGARLELEAMGPDAEEAATALCAHIDCLASEVRLNVDLDATLTVIANGCYRWLASQLKGFEKADPKQLFRRFIETAGTVTAQPDRLIVAFDRRSHNPILREAALGNDSHPITWLGQRAIEFTYH